MNAIIVGVKRIDFGSRREQVKVSSYCLNIVDRAYEGYAIGKISINELEDERTFQVGEVVQVEYNEKGNVRFADDADLMFPVIPSPMGVSPSVPASNHSNASDVPGINRTSDKASDAKPVEPLKKAQ